jgi:hypothetical protein
MAGSSRFASAFCAGVVLGRMARAVIGWGNSLPIMTSIEWQIAVLADYLQFFATVTWNPHKLGSVWKRIHHVKQWLKQWARKGDVSERYLIYITRWEQGETGGLPHAHLLVGGFAERRVSRTACFFAKNTWAHGVAQVRLFNPGRVLGTAAYMTKGKFSAYWTQGANNYEIKKFGQTNYDSIYFSRRAEEMLRQIAGVEERA